MKVRKRCSSYGRGVLFICSAGEFGRRRGGRLSAACGVRSSDDEAGHGMVLPVITT